MTATAFYALPVFAGTTTTTVAQKKSNLLGCAKSAVDAFTCLWTGNFAAGLKLLGDTFRDSNGEISKRRVALAVGVVALAVGFAVTAGCLSPPLPDPGSMHTVGNNTPTLPPCACSANGAAPKP